MVGRAAIQGDARAHPVATHGAVVRLAQQGGAVAHAALTGQVVGGGIKHLPLVGNAARTVGIGEMRHVANVFHLRQRRQPRPRAAVAQRGEAQAVHARIHLQKHALR